MGAFLLRALTRQEEAMQRTPYSNPRFNERLARLQPRFDAVLAQQLAAPPPFLVRRAHAYLGRATQRALAGSPGAHCLSLLRGIGPPVLAWRGRGPRSVAGRNGILWRKPLPVELGGPQLANAVSDGLIF